MGLLRINHNIAALNTQRHLNYNSFNLNKALQRLSSGYRINVAADGPADLVISELLRDQIGGINAALRNTQEAANLIGLAEGALIEVNSLLTQLRGLAIHSANTGVVTAAQVAADQAEADDIIDSIDRIDQATRFADTALFDGLARTFHIGEGAGGVGVDEVQVTFNDMDPAVLGTGAGGDALTTIQTAGANDFATDPLAAIGVITTVINEVSTFRADMGAFQKNKLRTNIQSLGVALENVTATESFIRDANMASETTEFTKNQILVQSGVSVLAQANVVSQAVLQLLQ